MTETAAAKFLIVMFPVPTVALAVVETSTQVAIVNLVTLVVVTVGGAFSIWIALQQAKLKATVDTLETNTNSKLDALVKTTARAERAEGAIEGEAKAKSDAAIATAAKAECAAEAAAKKVP